MIVSFRVIVVANSQGAKVLFRLSESEETKYSLKWGSLYANFKQDAYWFFILEYVWVLSKSFIVSLGQVNQNNLEYMQRQI